MADANCEVDYTLEEDCCDVDLAPPVIEPPPEEPPPVEPPLPEPPEPECPYYCGFGSPEGVQESVFNAVEVIGGMYEQLDVATTSHPWWAKETVGGTTGWRPWAGLGSTGLLSYRIGDGSLASGDGALSFGKSSLASGVSSVAVGESTQATGLRAEAFGFNSIASATDAKAMGSGAQALSASSLAFGVGAIVNTGAPSGIAFGSNTIIAANATDAINIGKDQTVNKGLTFLIGARNVIETSSFDPWFALALGLDNSFDNDEAALDDLIMIGVGNEVFAESFDGELIVIGRNNQIAGAELVCIGKDQEAGFLSVPGTGVTWSTYGVQIGLEVETHADCFAAIGYQALAYGIGACAMGPHTRAGLNRDSVHTTALGRFADVQGDQSVGLGSSTFVPHFNSIAIGHGAGTHNNHELMVGTDSGNTIDRVCFNSSTNPMITLSSTGVATFIGSLIAATTSVNTNTTLDTSHGTVRVDTSGANRTITLPAASTVTGRVYTIMKSTADANTVTIDANGAETINGALTKVLTTQYEKVTIQSNGTSWDIIG